jgi:hypothetical protein
MARALRLRYAKRPAYPELAKIVDEAEGELERILEYGVGIYARA